MRRMSMSPEKKSAHCTSCKRDIWIEDEHAETLGYEEGAREIWVIDLECGHCIELPMFAS
jgi:hypothetical protein